MGGEPEKDILDRVKNWHENPKLFVWATTAEQILESLTRLPRLAVTPCPRTGGKANLLAYLVGGVLAGLLGAYGARILHQQSRLSTRK